MEVKQYLYSEYLHWDDINDLGEAERFATILNDGTIEPVKYGDNVVKRVILTLQLQHDKTIIKYKCNKRTLRNLTKAWGTDTEKWSSKVVKLDPFVYQGDKETIELKPSSKEEFDIDKGLQLGANIGIAEIMKELENIKKSKD